MLCIRNGYLPMACCPRDIKTQVQNLVKVWPVPLSFLFLTRTFFILLPTRNTSLTLNPLPLIHFNSFHSRSSCVLLLPSFPVLQFSLLLSVFSNMAPSQHLSTPRRTSYSTEPSPTRPSSFLSRVLLPGSSSASMELTLYVSLYMVIKIKLTKGSF